MLNNIPILSYDEINICKTEYKFICSLTDNAVK